MNIPFLTPLARASYEHEAISDILIPAASVTVLTLSSFWKPKKEKEIERDLDPHSHNISHVCSSLDSWERHVINGILNIYLF